MPRYLDERDHIWLKALLDEFERFVGQRRSDLRRHLSEPLPVRAPAAKLRVAIRVLERLYDAQAGGAVDPRRARAALFGAAARTGSRDEALRLATTELGIEAEQLLDCLFADLPGERLLLPLAEPVSAVDLALMTNHAMIASLLRRATSVRITAEGKTSALVRSAKLRGLICMVDRGEGAAIVLRISGPFSLFRHTLVYGRALAALLPRLSHCDRFVLHAECLLDRTSGPVALTVRSGDPLRPARELPAFDSAVEERFARSFIKRAKDWDLVREPEPIPVSGGLFFPDFLVRHRRDRYQFAYVEIVGFWTAEYLEKKLAHVKAIPGPLVLLIDERRQCGDGDFPKHAQVIRYRGRIPVDAVLNVLDNGRLRASWAKS